MVIWGQEKIVHWVCAVLNQTTYSNLCYRMCKCNIHFRNFGVACILALCRQKWHSGRDSYNITPIGVYRINDRVYRPSICGLHIDVLWLDAQLLCG